MSGPVLLGWRAGIPCRYVTSQLGQLSPASPGVAKSTASFGISAVISYYGSAEASCKNLQTAIVRILSFLPARRYASSGISYDPVSVSVCICPSVTSRCSIKRDERINMVFGTEASFDQ